MAKIKESTPVPNSRFFLMQVAVTALILVVSLGSIFLRSELMFAELSKALAVVSGLNLLRLVHVRETERSEYYLKQILEKSQADTLEQQKTAEKIAV